MDTQPQGSKLLPTVLALVLWLASAALGLYSIYLVKELFILIFVSLGGSLSLAERFSLGILYFFGLVYMVFIVTTTEFHLKRVGRSESWRLFGWTLAVELSILLLYIFL